MTIDADIYVFACTPSAIDAGAAHTCYSATNSRGREAEKCQHKLVDEAHMHLHTHVLSNIARYIMGNAF